MLNDMIIRSLNNYQERLFVHLLKYLCFITLHQSWIWNCHFKMSLTWPTCCVSDGCFPAVKAGLLEYALGTTYFYNYRTFTTVNEPHIPYKTNLTSHVGHTITSEVQMTPVWHSGSDTLVKIVVRPMFYDNKLYIIWNTSVQPYTLHKQLILYWYTIYLWYEAGFNLSMPFKVWFYVVR